MNKTLNLENILLGFKNFAGEKSQYNKTGIKNFVVFLDEEIANELSNKGWNIKKTKESENFESQYYLQVTIGNGSKIVVISGENVQTFMDTDDVSFLDWADIENVDIIINPYNWKVEGNSGIKAYLKTLYVTITVDAFQEKYGI